MRGVQRRPVVEQGAPLGCTAPGSDRALSKLPFGNNNVDSELFGDAYEYLIKKFADDSGHTAQEFYTNRTVVHLMVQMLAPKSGDSTAAVPTGASNPSWCRMMSG